MMLSPSFVFVTNPSKIQPKVLVGLGGKCLSYCHLHKMLSVWESAWIRGGKIKEITWVEKDVMAWNCGSHIVFFNTVTNKLDLYRPSEADGVCCMIGNPIMRIFAFSENSREPQIFVYDYQKMEKISQCMEKSEGGYLTIVFASSDYLISLGRYGNFSLTVWSWRTGNKLFSIATKIDDFHNQMMKVTLSRPTLIAQLGRDSGRLLIWEMIATTPMLMSSEEVFLPKKALPVNVDWSTDSADPVLAIVDVDGHVYISNKEGCEVNQVVFSQRCTLCLNYEIPVVCWHRGGIILKTTFCQIRYFKKATESFWKRQWYVKTPLKPSILSPHPFKKDKVYYYTEEGHLDLMNMTSGSELSEIEKKLYLGRDYRFIDFIYPWGHHSVIIDDFQMIIIDSYDGEEIGALRFEPDTKIIQLSSHPDYPMIAVTTISGELIFISVHDFRNPSIIRKYQLQNDPLDILKFSQCGRHLLTATKESGHCFCVTSTADDSFSIIHDFNVDHSVADVIFFESNNILKIVVLLLASKKIFVGNHVLIYQILLDDEIVKKPTSIIRLPASYQNLHYAYGRELNFIATPYLSKQLHFLSLKEDEVKLLKVISTEHQVRGIKISSNRRTISTCGFDGLVGVIKNHRLFEPLINLTSHHRKYMGVCRAICNPSGDLVIALGRDGSIICVRIRENIDETQEIKLERRKKYLLDYSTLDPDIVAMLSQPCRIIPSETDSNLVWVDWRSNLKVKKEEKEYHATKSILLNDFNVIKAQVSKMLDENKECPEIEQLPISVFDLDKFAREQKIKQAKEERENIRLELEFKCSDSDRIWTWIKETFWDPQEVKDQSIFGIFGSTEVTNYSTEVSEDTQEKQIVMWNESLGQVDQKRNSKRESQLYSMLKNKYTKSCEDEKTIVESLMADGAEYEELEEMNEELRATGGITTYRFVKPSIQFSQFEDYTFAELQEMNNKLVKDEKKLRNYFNRSFNEMYSFKESEMSTVRDQISRIRHIDSELKLMFGQFVSEIPENPTWIHKEKPESIIQVLDHEIQVKPWISTSQQELLNKREAEVKRLQLLLMADDFREKALMVMMDGVLEVRWEDIIKKDILKPQCMLNKIPEDYTVEDIVTVQKYEKEVQFLIHERERYRRILESEYSKAMKTLKDVVERFNIRLQDFFVKRMMLESAIQQLSLFRARGYLRTAYHLETSREISDLNDKILNDREKINNIQELNQRLHNEIPNLRNQREVLFTREKAFEKKFRGEFPTLGKIALTILGEQYMKRPKVSLKHATAGDVLELGRCILSRCEVARLSHDYLEYLKGLEVLDVQPPGLPDSIEHHHWEHFVKVRRVKIDMEMKIKANTIEMMEIEKSISEHNKRIGMCKSEVCSFGDQLDKIKQDRINFDFDTEIQLVLKMAQIEIVPHGERDDTENSNFMPKIQIERVNQEILSASSKKLRAIERTIKCRRGTLFQEWEHKCLRMKMEDLEDELYQVQNVFVTKDILEFLKRKSKREKDKKTSLQLEREIEAMRKNLDKSLRDWLLKLEDIEKKIGMKKRDNDVLDKVITRMNVRRWEMELQRNLESEDRWKNYTERKMKLVVWRSKVVRKIQKIYSDNLALGKEFELLKSKKYPSVSWLQVVTNDCD